MKNIFLILAAATLVFSACKKDDDSSSSSSSSSSLTSVLSGLTQDSTVTPSSGGAYSLTYYSQSGATKAVVVSGQIDENVTFDNAKYWVLSGRVFVTSGNTLTINAGTIVMGSDGTGLNAASLVIANGGSINAVGTSSSPIIFTSIFDNIALGATAGTNLSVSNRGLWGGLVVLGDATIGEDGGADQIEGVPASETLGQYGGSDDAHNAGTLSYISIRHGGATIATDNEINGLSLAGLGTGTTVNNIEIVGNNDDGMEIWGGFVNVTNVLVWGQKDDGIDIDEDYQGRVRNFMVIANSSDNMLEIDGTEHATNSTNTFNLDRGTIIGGGSGSADRLALFKSAANCTIDSVYWKGFSTADSDQRVENDGSTYTPTNLQFDANYTVDASDVNGTANMTVVTTPTVGATESAFNWTYANSKSAF